MTTRPRSPLSEREARRIKYDPAAHRTCPRCGYVVRDILRHHVKYHGGRYAGPQTDADDFAAQHHLRARSGL